MAAKEKKHRTEILTGVPNDRVEDIVGRVKKSPRYVSHMTIPEDDDFTTIVVVLKV